MANQIQVKRTSTGGRTPNTTSSGNTQYINAGEFALNMTDQILYTSDGTNLITVGANIVNQKVTGTLTVNNVSVSSNITLNNNVDLNFKALSGANVSFIQQNDDNFVFYSTNTSGGQRAVWAVFGNSVTSNFNTVLPLQPSGGISANGSLGTAGQVLSSNGSATYWTTPGSASVNTAATWTWSNTQTFNGNVVIGTSASVSANGTVGTAGQVLTSNGTTVYWAATAAGINTAAQYTWTNTQTFSNTITFSTNILVGTTVNATSYNTGGGYGSATGGFIANSTVIAIGNSTVNVTINSTTSTATANNASYLGGTSASSFVANTGLFQNTSGYFVNAAYIATISANNASYLGGTAAASYALLAGPTFTGTVTTANTLTIGTAAYHVANGNLGLGTSSPAATLDVVGTVNTSKANTLNQTLTDGATITWDTSIGQIATVTLAGNRTMAAPTNLKVSTYILHVIQDVTGSRTLTWNSVFKWPAGVAPVLSTGANKRDVFTFVSDGTNLYGSYLPDVR